MKYLLILLSSIIGVLVVVLKIQGGKLHEAQIHLLANAINAGQDHKDSAVILAKTKLQAALKAYYKSGKGQ